MKNFYKNKRILVAGGTGLVGIQVIKILDELGAKVTSVSLDRIKIESKNIKFIKKDLRNFKNCVQLTKNIDIVINLAGVAGSPQITRSKPKSIFTPNILFAINLLEASVINNIKYYLHTSSYGVYNPDGEMKENENIWMKNLSPNDLFGGWSKRTGELHVEAIRKEYPKMIIPIIRPSNIFGPYANFDNKNSMVVPSLISKITSSPKEVKMFGDGSQVRDFVYSKDVARMILLILNKKINGTFNVGSGKGVSIKTLANKIKLISNSKSKLKFEKKAFSGDKKRILNVSKAKKNKVFAKTSFDQSLKDTINWYLKNKSLYKKRYNSFLE